MQDMQRGPNYTLWNVQVAFQYNRTIALSHMHSANCKDSFGEEDKYTLNSADIVKW